MGVLANRVDSWSLANETGVLFMLLTGALWDG